MTARSLQQRADNAATEPVMIRRAHATDAGLVHRLVLEMADHEGSRAAVEVTGEDWWRLLNDARVVVLMAFAGDRPVGYVSAVRHVHLWCGREMLALDDLYVRPGARNTGVGTQLMTALAACAAAAGLPVIRWEMEEGNVHAQRFYRRLGASLRRKVIATWAPDQPCRTEHRAAGTAQ